MLLLFFVITYAISWALFVAAGARMDGGTPSPLAQILFLAGAITPSFVALALTARAQGATSAGALLRRVLHWQVPGRWYLFAIGYFGALKLAVAAILRVATGAWPRFGSEPIYIMLLAVAVSTWAQAGEEIGWRGYALPRLASRLGLRWASLLLGVIWATWHLPLFFLVSTDKVGQSFPLYLLQVTALSVTLAWLYARTGGSLLLVMLMHAAINNTKDIVPSAVPGATSPLAWNASPVGWLTLLLLWIGAACFLVRMPKRLDLAVPPPEERRLGAPAG